jgi:hypothetical protein
MPEMLQEYVDSRGVAMRVDRAAGVIRGVKILGLQSRNGRTYLPDALVEAAPLYEHAKVNVNHPKSGPHAPRDYQDRLGVIRNVAVRPGEGLFGDLHFNPKHTLAEQLLWDAEHCPENVGLSHNVEARTGRSGDQVVVEAILRVESVDLVADPATTRGLFESDGEVKGAAADSSAADSAAPDFAAAPASDQIGKLTLEALKQQRPDLVEAIGRETAAELARLRAEVGRFEAVEALRKKQARARQLLKEFNLPDPDRAEGWTKALVSPRFFQALLEASTEEGMRQMVEERAGLARSVAALAPAERRTEARPLSRDQLALDLAGPQDAKAFVAAIT